MLVQRGVVASLGRSLTITPGTRLLDVSGRIVVPGLVGVASQLAAQPLGAEAPALLPHHDARTAASTARAGAIDALSNGVTTVCDVGVPGASVEVADAVRSALEDAGIRSAASQRAPVGAVPVRGLAGLDGDRDELVANTIGAAEVLGLHAEVGSVEVGKWADLVVLAVDADIDRLDDDELYGLVASGRARIEHVLVAGAERIRDGALTGAAAERGAADGVSTSDLSEPAPVDIAETAATLRRRRDASSA